MADIFISYSQKDRPWVKRLVDALTAKGWDVWWDINIRSGESFDQVIQTKLEKVRCVLVVWSQHSVKSEWVRAETAWAKKRNKLVSMRIQELELPVEFYHVHTDNLTDWDGSRDYPAFRKLVEDIGALAPISASKTQPEPAQDAQPKPEPEKAKSEPAQEQVSKPAATKSPFLKRRVVVFGMLSIAVAGGALYFGIPYKTDVEGEPESSTASQDAGKSDAQFVDKPVVVPTEPDKTPPVPKKEESQSAREPLLAFRDTLKDGSQGPDYCRTIYAFESTVRALERQKSTRTLLKEYKRFVSTLDDDTKQKFSNVDKAEQEGLSIDPLLQLYRDTLNDMRTECQEIPQ